MKSKRQTLTRLGLHLVVVVLLVALVLFKGSLRVLPKLDFYIFVGILTFAVTLFAAVVALIKFDTRNKSKYLLVSLGLLGASFIDGYNFVIKKGYILMPDQNPAVSYFSIMSLLSYLIWVNPSLRYTLGKAGKKLQIILWSILVGLIVLLVLYVLRLSSVVLIVVSTVCFTISVVGYLAKGTWKHKYFDQLFVTSLLILIFSQLFLFNLSGGLSQMSYTISTTLELVGFSFTMIGLLMSTYNAFKLAEEHGETIEARLTSSISSLPLGYVLMDSSNQTLIVNEKIKSMLGDIDAEKTNLFLRKKLKTDELIEKSRTLRDTVKIPEFDFHEKIFEIYIAPVYRSADFVGSVILFADITEAKLLDRSKDEFIALASHELRTPLVTIRGNVDLLKSTHPEILKDSDINEIVCDIDVASDKFIKIVNEFLDVSSLEQSRIEYKKQKFDIVKLAEATVKEFTPIAFKKGVKLEKLKTKKTLLVEADGSRTSQIIDNLVSNAIKFTQKGKVQIGIGEKNGMAVITVSDTGKGISEDDQKMLFKKFQQVGGDYYKHDSTQGVGLGLYLIRMLVNGMGGKIYLVKSKPDVGSEFAFELPLADH